MGTTDQWGNDILDGAWPPLDTTLFQTTSHSRRLSNDTAKRRIFMFRRFDGRQHLFIIELYPRRNGLRDREVRPTGEL